MKIDHLLEKRKPIDWRIYGLLWFLALPSLIFFLSWIMPVFGIPATLSIIYILCSFKSLKDSVSYGRESVLAIISLVLVVISGNGEFNFQTYDHFKHNFMFADLVKYDWPVYYDDGSEHLNYYLGYYLMPALLGKIFGIKFVASFSIITLSLGFYLALSYLLEKLNWTFYELLFFLFFSSFACLSLLFRFISDPNIALNEIFDNLFLIWNGPWGRYPQIPVFDSFRWVPQHFLASLSMFLFYKEASERSPLLIPNIIAIGFFWSAHSSIAALLFLMLVNRKYLLSKKLTAILPSVVIFAIVGGYYWSHAQDTRNLGNFSFSYLKPALYLSFSILTYCLSLVVVSYLFIGKISKAIIHHGLIYITGAAVLGMSGDFDLFARGTIIFQIYLLTFTINEIKNNSHSLQPKNILKTVTIILFIFPALIALMGPSLYYLRNHKNWPKPAFSIQNAYEKFGSIKEVHCAIKENDFSFQSSNNCDSSELTNKYSGFNSFLLKAPKK